MLLIWWNGHSQVLTRSLTHYVISNTSYWVYIAASCCTPINIYMHYIIYTTIYTHTTLYTYYNIWRYQPNKA